MIGNLDTDFIDCRVFCFNGKSDFIQVDIGFAYGDTKRAHHNLEWNRLDFKMKYDNMEKPISKPENIDEVKNYQKNYVKILNL